jgi:hypothetical protein
MKNINDFENGRVLENEVKQYCLQEECVVK